MVVRLCPECGRFIDSNKESFVKHAMSHWRVAPNRVHELRSPEARRRYNALVHGDEVAAEEA